MNILIGKIGRSSYFDKANWSIYAGDDSPKIIYETLAKAYPQHNFYMIGGSDLYKIRADEAKSQVGFKRLTAQPTVKVPSNIIDVFGPAKKMAKENKTLILDEEVNWINNNHIKFDAGIILQGPDFSVSIPNKGICCKKDKTALAHPLEMGINYSAPIMHVLNTFKVPWININEDPRYVPYNGRDLTNDEIVILSQIQKDIKVDRIEGYFEKSSKMRSVTEHFVYAGTEKMFLAEKVKADFTNPDSFVAARRHYTKNNKFIMTLNGSPDRYDFVKRWVLDKDPTVKIYGKWDEKSIKDSKYKDNFEAKGIVEIEDLMWSSKFTFVPCFEKRLSNFVTQKVWKMIYYGIIPFWDKRTYDTDNYYKDMPDYFKVSSPDEMWQKIDELENNKELYVKYLKEYYALLDDKYFSGQFIIDSVNKYIKL